MRKLIFIILMVSALTTAAHADLLSHWKLDETTGTTASDSADGNPGTVYGAQWVTGRLGGALSFDGVNDYVNLGNSSSLKPSLPLTISTWVKLSTVDIDQEILCLDNQSTNYYGIWFFVQSDNTLQISYGDGGSPGPSSRRTKVGTTALASDEWYHIAAVLRGPTDMDLYINAAADTGIYDGTGGNLMYSTGTSLIGCNSRFESYLSGVLDDVRLYDRALSQSEIYALTPEPATLFLLGLGSLALLRKRIK
jgi:hypothetical protein